MNAALGRVLAAAAALVVAACENPLRDRLETLVADYEQIVAEGAVYVHGSAGADDNPGTRERPRRSIQSGIDLLVDLGIRGEVRVAEGTYVITAPLVVADGIALRGGYDEGDWDQRDIQEYETVLQGSGVAQVVGFAEQAGEDTLLEGFTVQAAPGATAMAVLCELCSPTIRFNHIDASIGNDTSTGVYSLSGSPVIEANTIDAGQGAGSCWGIVNSASAARVRNNVIYCTAVSGAFSAIVNWQLSAAVIQNNTIHLERSGDVGIYNLCGRIVVENNIIYASASDAFGVKECDASARPVRLNNNDIHGCSVVYDHAGGDCTNVAQMEAYLAGAGAEAADNVDADPVFEKIAERDYHLTGACPGVSEGGLSLSVWFTGDRDGVDRIPPWSIGAYEYPP